MKSTLKKIVLASALALPLSANVLATPCEIIPGSFPPKCKPQELPEPGSPLLFLIAAGVAGVVLKIRKKK